MAAFALALSLLAVTPAVEIVGEAELFAPGIASTDHAEIRLTISPDGRTALWFSRDRPGGPGGYDIWIARREGTEWAPATPVSFNSPGRDFDPAFSRDGRFVYFCSDRPGGIGKDDLYRVAVTATGFGTPENLGPQVNSAASEYAPMLSPDGRRLLFSSDRPGGAGRHDLYTARSKGRGFAAAAPLARGDQHPRRRIRRELSRRQPDLGLRARAEHEGRPRRPVRRDIAWWPLRCGNDITPRSERSGQG